MWFFVRKILQLKCSALSPIIKIERDTTTLNTSAIIKSTKQSQRKQQQQTYIHILHNNKSFNKFQWYIIILSLTYRLYFPFSNSTNRKYCRWLECEWVVFFLLLATPSYVHLGLIVHLCERVCVSLIFVLLFSFEMCVCGSECLSLCVRQRTRCKPIELESFIIVAV